MDINLLLESRGSESPASKKSSTLVASDSDLARTYTTASSAHTGGPVLPAASETQRKQHLSIHPQSRRYLEHPDPGPAHHGPPGSNRWPPHQVTKRQASQAPLPDESPAKKQSKWTPEEDNLTIGLRGQGMKWDDIAKRFPGRSPTSCRLRYQNYLEKRAIWDEEKKDQLVQLYHRCVTVLRLSSGHLCIRR